MVEARDVTEEAGAIASRCKTHTAKSPLAVCWVAVTAGAWLAAVQRKIELHRLLMRFSYAMTFGAVTLRMQIPLGVALGYGQGCWGNVCGVEICGGEFFG